jgi:hypothetical protein
MRIHFLFAILASLPFINIADSVPKFDIAREYCSEGSSKAILDQYITDEAKAREGST